MICNITTAAAKEAAMATSIAVAAATTVASLQLPAYACQVQMLDRYHDKNETRPKQPKKDKKADTDKTDKKEEKLKKQKTHEECDQGAGFWSSTARWKEAIDAA